MELPESMRKSAKVAAKGLVGIIAILGVSAGIKGLQVAEEHWIEYSNDQAMARLCYGDNPVYKHSNLCAPVTGHISPTESHIYQKSVETLAFLLTGAMITTVAGVTLAATRRD